VEYTAEEHLCGADGVVHGGIQATLLDEACGFSCRTVFEGDADDLTIPLWNGLGDIELDRVSSIIEDLIITIAWDALLLIP
jgi:hypothetical protein